MEHPGLKWKAKQDMYENRNNSLEQDIALGSLFKYYSKTFEADLETRSLWAKKLAELKYSNKDISEAVDEVVTKMAKFPTLAEFMTFLPSRQQNQVHYSSDSKELEYERKSLEHLKNEFKKLLCNDNEEEYITLMTKLTVAYLEKVHGLTKQQIEFYGYSYKLYQSCVLMDWRDSNFNPKLIFETGIKKAEKIRSDLQINTNINKLVN